MAKRRIFYRQNLEQAATLSALCALGYRFLAQGGTLLGNGILARWLTGPGAGTVPARLEALSWALSLLTSAVSLLLPVWLAVRLGKLPLRRLGLRPGRPGMTLPALLLYLGGAQLAGLLAGFVGQATGSTQDISLPESGGALALAWLALCVLPPVLEELLFRGAMQNLVRPYGVWPAILAQAIPFALLHRGASAMVFALAAGLFFGWLAVRSGSLLPGICIHFVNNTLAFGLMLLPRIGAGRLAAGINIGLLVVCPLLALLVFWVGGQRRRRKRRVPGNSPLVLLGCRAWLGIQIFLLLCALLGL